MAVLKKEAMLSLAENAVKVAMQKGASEAEAYVYEGQATNIGIELGQISKTNRIIDRGVGIRVAANKAVGFAYTNVIDDVIVPLSGSVMVLSRPVIAAPFGS